MKGPSNGYTPPPKAVAAPNSGAFGNLGGVSSSGQTLASIVGQGVPDPTRAQMMAGLIAKNMKIGPNDDLTPQQAARVQRIVSAQGGSFPNTQTGHEAFIRQRAEALGIDPNFAVSVASAEGLRALSPQNPNGASSVDRNPDGTPFSYGDFQLNVRNGLGTEARKAGVNPADPKQWQAADEYALETMAKGGLAPWKGDAAVSAYQAQGGGWQAPRLSGAPASRAIADATGGPRPVAGGGGSALTTQYGLPPGMTPQQAIVGLDRSIAQLAGNPESVLAVHAMQDMRDRLAKSIEPIEVRAGTNIVDPYGRPLYQAPSAFEQKATTAKSRAADIAGAIERGEAPPNLTGLYSDGPAVRQKLAQDGFDLARHQLEYQGAQKQVASLNGPQQTRFAGLAKSVSNTIDEVRELADQMQLSSVPLLNKAELAAYVQAEGNSPNGMLATNYLTAVGTLKEEFANLANGGYAPTEPAWHLADQQINANYGVKQLNSSLGEVQRLINYRLHAMPNMDAIGPGAANPYLPQSPPPPPQSDKSRSSSGLAPGRYRYDPATGNFEPVT